MVKCVLVSRFVAFCVRFGFKVDEMSVDIYDNHTKTFPEEQIPTDYVYFKNYARIIWELQNRNTPWDPTMPECAAFLKYAKQRAVHNVSPTYNGPVGLEAAELE